MIADGNVAPHPVAEIFKHQLALKLIFYEEVNVRILLVHILGWDGSSLNHFCEEDCGQVGQKKRQVE